jgi:elongation factor P--(R)-beta-lysine ligase
MSLAQKSKTWQPTASLLSLQGRAQVLSDIRAFFQKRAVLEVETPLMCQGATTDPYIQSFSVSYSPVPGTQTQHFYLQTSPEFAMKRLLAAGSGPIYQICKAFRKEESGRLHNPEFTILEWYQPGFDHHALMDEMEALLCVVLGLKSSERFSYQAIFENTLGFNPHTVSLAQLKHCAVSKGIILSSELIPTLSVDDYLDILMTHCIEPHLGSTVPAMIYDFPASKAALAKIRFTEEVPVAERFEVYFKGVELANGYHELTDPEVQLSRLQADCAHRKNLGYSEVPIDLHLIEALKAGLPDSAGVALGVDRLVMLKLGNHEIQEVVPFTIDRA